MNSVFGRAQGGLASHHHSGLLSFYGSLTCKVLIYFGREVATVLLIMYHIMGKGVVGAVIPVVVAGRMRAASGVA